MKNEAKNAMAGYLAIWEARADLLTGKPGISKDFDSCYDALDSFPEGRKHIDRLELELDVLDCSNALDDIATALRAI